MALATLVMKTLASLVLAATISLTGCQLAERIRVNEVGIATGQAYGQTKKGAMHVTPVHVRIGTDVNHFLNITNDYGRLQLAPELFCNPITKPDHGIEAGVCAMVRYTPPMETTFRPYVEGGAGPMFLDADTPDQTDGFNFMIQGGAGIQYFIDKDVSLSLGYRYRHISNGNTDKLFKSDDVPNHGLDTHAIIFGIAKHF